jgi:hypothetical protein
MLARVAFQLETMMVEPAFFVPLASDRGYPRPRRSMPAMIHFAFNR